MVSGMVAGRKVMERHTKVTAATPTVNATSAIYNLGCGGDGYSVREVIEAAREVTGHAIPIALGPRRAGDPAVLVASSDRIRSELGFRPERQDLRLIIESAWRWVTANTNRDRRAG